MPHTFRPQEVSVYLNKNVNIRSSQKPTSENTIRNLVICTWNRFQLLITIHDDNHRNAEISMAFQGAGERNIKILVQKWAYGTPVCVCQFLSPWDFPGKNTGEGCHFLLQGIFPTQRSNLGLLYCRQILYHLSYQGSPIVPLYSKQPQRPAVNTRGQAHFLWLFMKSQCLAHSLTLVVHI